jgi:hypothetical protein
MADQETIDARTGNIEGVVELNDNVGTYTDPLNHMCTLDIKFNVRNVLSVAGGDACDATIGNFAGDYYRK